MLRMAKRDRAWWESKAASGELGGMPDHVFAKKYKTGLNAPYRWRKRLGIPTPGREHLTAASRVNWEKVKRDGLFDSMNNAQLGRHLGVSRCTVRKYRALADAGRPLQSSYVEAWESWSKRALNEIDKVVERNDDPPRGWRYIPLRKMVTRLRNGWGIEDATAEVVERYCRTVLGRHSWRRQ